jgi:hypothetical protein
MKRHNHPPRNLLLHPLFLFSLFLLLLNDISLKYEFHNGFTGKLSDFAGLFVFAVFWLAILPRFRWQVVIITALLFIWWKSSLSSSFIQAWNEMMPVPVTRVVDYWDLTALTMLPLAFLLSRSNYDPKIRYRRFFIPLAGCISLFSFCFTSAPRYGLYYSPPNQINFYGDFKTSKTEQQILEKLISKNISFHRDSVGFYPLRDGEYYLKVNEHPTDSSKWVRVNNNQDSVLYIRRQETPFYVIPDYNLDGHQLKDVKFRIETRNKKAYVFVQTFQWNNRDEYSSKMKKQYKKHFQKLFE